MESLVTFLKNIIEKFDYLGKLQGSIREFGNVDLSKVTLRQVSEIVGISSSRATQVNLYTSRLDYCDRLDSL